MEKIDTDIIQQLEKGDKWTYEFFLFDMLGLRFVPSLVTRSTLPRVRLTSVLTLGNVFFIVNVEGNENMLIN